MTVPDRAAVEAAVEQLDAALRTVFGLRAPVLELGPQSVDALRTVLDALERLRRAEQQPGEATGGEQVQDGAAPEMPPPPFVAALTDKVLATMQPAIAMSVRHLLASRSVWRAHAYRSGAERDALVARVAELAAESEADVRMVRIAVDIIESLWNGDARPADVIEAHEQLHVRFADRIAALGADAASSRPRIVCLCGSTRFRAEHEAANRALTMEGCIVLGLGAFSHSEGISITEAEKVALDALHLAKIDLANEIFVVNPGGYIGTSTAAEIAYATKCGKPVRYLVEES